MLHPSLDKASTFFPAMLLAAVLMNGCDVKARTPPVGGEPAATDTSIHADAVARPHDPWVFRCVLDKRPRTLVVALAEGCWLAFDTNTGGIAKVFTQPVSFQGAVYTGGHGPQPKTLPPYLESHEPGTTGWVVADAQGGELPLRFMGYRMEGEDSVSMVYTSHEPGVAPADDSLRIVLSPRWRDDPAAGSAVQWELRVGITGLPEGWTVTQKLGESDADRRVETIRTATPDNPGMTIDQTRGMTISHTADHEYSVVHGYASSDAVAATLR